MLQSQIESTETVVSSCWIWLGWQHRGYGCVTTERGDRYLHREVYQERHGPLPSKIELHHACGVKACYNPVHLVPLSPRDHQHAHAARRSRCRNGHPNTEADYRFVPTTEKWRFNRQCRICLREYDRRRYERIKNTPAYKEKHARAQRAYMARTSA